MEEGALPKPIEAINGGKHFPESTKKPLGEKVAGLLSFLKKADVVKNPDSGFQAILSIPDDGGELNQEDSEAISNANQLLETFGKIRDILAKVKDNELAAGAVVAGVGIISSLALGGEAQIAIEAASVGIGSIGGSGKDILKNAAFGVAGIAGTQGIEHFAGSGLDNTVDLASNFVDIGKDASKSIGKEILATPIRKVGEIGRSRMIARV